MSVPFVALLRTNRALERGVSFHGATQASVEAPAKNWLDAFGVAGDEFVVVENVPTQRAVIVCEKPPAPVEKRALKGHEFKSDPRQPLRCDRCGNFESEHV